MGSLVIIFSYLSSGFLQVTRHGWNVYRNNLPKKYSTVDCILNKFLSFSCSYLYLVLLHLTELSTRASHRHRVQCHRNRHSAVSAFRYRTGSPYFGIGLLPASSFSFIPVLDWPAFKNGKKDTPCKSLLQWRGIHPHVHTVDCGKGYNLKSTLLCWKGKHRYVHSTTCWWWKGIHPHVHTFDCGNENTLTSTLLVVETYKPWKVKAGKKSVRQIY